jgi:intracellular multiplication protein IcmL
MANPRNKDYVRIGFVNGAAVFFIYTVVIFIFSLQYLQKTPTYYTMQSQNGSVFEKRIVSVKQPLMPRQALLNWASTAVTSIFTFDANNYQTVLPEMVRRYFDPRGVQGFLKALIASGQVSEVVQKQLILSAVVSNTPVILESGPLMGAYSWKVQVPLLLTYQSASEVHQERQIITLLIRSIPTTVSPYGIAIEQFTVQKG